MNKTPKLGCIILVLLILCISLPIVWLEAYTEQYCWFPPRDPNIQVIVSACDHPTLGMMSPDGRYLPYTIVTAHGYEAWVLDTVTGQLQRDTSCGEWWLSKTLKLGGYTQAVDTPGKFTVCNIIDGTELAAQWVEAMPGTTTQSVDGTETFSAEVVGWFRNAEQVYYISFRQWAVALGPDFKDHPERAYILASEDYYPNSILKFLKDKQISYTEINFPSQSQRSHDGRFIASFVWREGFSFLTVADEHLISKAEMADLALDTMFAGWAYDDSGIYILSRAGESLIIPPILEKKQPVLKIYLPPEYLTSTAQQELADYQKQARTVLVVRFSELIFLVVAGVLLFWWRRKVNRTTMQ